MQEYLWWMDGNLLRFFFSCLEGAPSKLQQDFLDKFMDDNDLPIGVIDWNKRQEIKEFNKWWEDLEGFILQPDIENVVESGWKIFSDELECRQKIFDEGFFVLSGTWWNVMPTKKNVRQEKGFQIKKEVIEKLREARNKNASRLSVLIKSFEALTAFLQEDGSYYGFYYEQYLSNNLYNIKQIEELFHDEKSISIIF